MPKSPFVSHAEVETFTYPAPLDESNAAEAKLIDKEAFAEEPHWIKIRVPRSAEDVDAVGDYTQSVLAMGNGDASAMESRIKRMNRGIFELLVEDWSFTTRKPNGDDYGRLDAWAAIWVRTALGEVVRKGTSPDFSPPTPSISETPESSPAELSAVSQND